MRTLALPAFALLAGCSGNTVLTLEVTPGHELDAFSRDPAITRMQIEGRSPEGDIVLDAYAAPGGEFSLGQVPDTRLLSFEVHGTDTTGAVAVHGKSLGIVAGGVQSDLMPVFAQRISEWARPPGAMDHTHFLGVAGVLGERYMLLTGGSTLGAETSATPATPAYYDMLGLAGAVGTALPRTAESLLLSADGVAALLVGSDGATWVDFQANTTLEVTAPTGLGSFAEVVGGTVVASSDGTRYLVGATRASSPSQAVLVWQPSSGVSAARLAYARQGAAATYIESVGVVVAGGNADPDVPGLEVLAAGASATATRPYPADAVRGAAAVPRTGGQLVLVGGYGADGPAPVRLVDAGCAAECVPKVLGITLGPSLDSCQAFAVDADHFILVGADRAALVTVGSLSSGAIRAFAVNVIDQSAAELALREPRAGAVPMGTPTGLLALLGGVHPDGTGATTIELLDPHQ